MLGSSRARTYVGRFAFRADLVRRYAPQPFVGILVSALALVALAGAWHLAPPALLTRAGLEHVLTLLVLGGAVVGAACFPIQIGYHTKVTVTSVPLYLLAVLVPPPLAALAAGLATLIEELLLRKYSGSLPSDIATSASRWVLVTWVSATVAQQQAGAGDGRFALALLAAALVMGVGDLLTSTLEIAPICGQRPAQVLVATAREAGVVEGVQYLLGVLGALAAVHQLWAVVLLGAPLVLVYRAFKHLKELRVTTRQLLETMADAVDLRDPYTGGHSRRVADVCQGILQAWPLWGPDAELIVAAARVHDIGKIGVPDQILHKPDRLTDAEWAVMETHAEQGAQLLGRYPEFARGQAIVRHHHEHWNGQGYPQQLAGTAIPFGARVIAVADSFDAMTSDRPYRRGMSIHQAAALLRTDNGQQWDPAVVEAFLRSIADRLEAPQ